MENLPTSRAEAKRLGSTYYHGNPCKRGHDGVRLTSSCHCVECQRQCRHQHYLANQEAERERARQYYRENLEAERERNRQRSHQRYWGNLEAERERKRQHYWENHEAERQGRRQHYLANQEAERERSRQRYWGNLEAERERKRQWAKANPEKCSAQKAKRRALKRNSLVSLGDSEKRTINVLYLFRQFLDNVTGTEWHVDHHIPLSQGGSHHPDNLKLMLARDNMSKHATIPEEPLRPWSGVPVIVF